MLRSTQAFRRYHDRAHTNTIQHSFSLSQIKVILIASLAHQIHSRKGFKALNNQVYIDLLNLIAFVKSYKMFQRYRNIYCRIFTIRSGNPGVANITDVSYFYLFTF